MTREPRQLFRTMTGLDDFVEMPDEVDDDTAAQLTDQAREVQDMTGEICPYPQVEAKKALQRLGTDDLLVQETDHVPSTENVPNAVDDMADAKVWRSGDGQYRVFLRKR
jgi:TusA-related sulfurtransferase